MVDFAVALGGAAQIGRGIANTPSAFRGRREQRVWDADLGQWVAWSLKEKVGAGVFFSSNKINK